MRDLHSIYDSRFEWMDYPGTALIQDSPDVEASINEASCLVLIVSGESFAFTQQDGKRVPISAKDYLSYRQIVSNNLLFTTTL